MHDIDAYLAYKIFEEDINKICQYIHPDDSNLDTYSHRVYEVFFRLCTEVETCFKFLIDKINYEQNTSIKKSNINDYINIEQHLSPHNHLSDYQVKFLFYMQEVRVFRPFASWEGWLGWSSGKPTDTERSKYSLEWYQKYNKVKHNRMDSLCEAKLKYMLNAYAALIILYYKCHSAKVFIGGRASNGGMQGGTTEPGFRQLKWSGCHFILSLPSSIQDSDITL